MSYQNDDYQSVDEIQRDYDRTHDSEYAVAARIVVGGVDALTAAEGTGLTAGMFVSDTYREVYAAAQALRDAGKPVDRAALVTRGINSALIADMANEPTAVDIKGHAELVIQDYTQRQARALLWEMQKINADPDTILAQFTALADKLHAGTHSGGLVMRPEELAAAFSNYERQAVDGSAVIRSGFPSIDKMLSGGSARGGFLRGGMYLLAGRPGEGKSSVVIAIADEIACNTTQGAVLYCSMEIPPQQVQAKRIARQTGVPSNAMLFHPDQLTDEQRKRRDIVAQVLPHTPFYMTNGGADMRMTVDGLIAAARSIKGLSVVVVDHIGLLRGSESNFGNMVGELSEVSRKLKMLAMKLNIVVIALSQFNRASTANGGTPTMFDLRGSASLEQDADAVIIVRRQDYGTADENGGAVQSVELIAEKNRHGRAGTKCSFDIDLPTNRLTERKTRTYSQAFKQVADDDDGELPFC